VEVDGDVRAVALSAARRTLREDALLAVAVALVLVLGADVALQDDLWAGVPDLVGPVVPEPGKLLVLLASTLPLAFRRIAPLAVLVGCVAASTVLQVIDRAPPLPLGVLVALYTIAVMRGPIISGGAALAYLAVVALGVATGWAPLSDDLLYTYLVAVVAAVSVGYGRALGHARARLAEQRAAELGKEQEALTRAAVESEQARIAREVHDIIAHDVSVIVAQAAAARRVLADRPAEAEQSLRSIESVGRDALDGLRRLLSLLRTDQTARERTPQPSLERLPWLLAQVRRAGLPVSLTVRGRAGPLPATVELNAYRIVQEALTNSLKHAAPTEATVELRYGDDALTLEIRDRGREAPTPPPTAPVRPTHQDTGSPGRDRGAGYGLISMQQRVAMLGGDLSAGHDGQGGFRVEARLPLAGGRP
jgi:signal transduction histidine kinase